MPMPVLISPPCPHGLLQNEGNNVLDLYNYLTFSYYPCHVATAPFGELVGHMFIFQRLPPPPPPPVLVYIDAHTLTNCSSLSMHLVRHSKQLELKK